ncbi:MAG: hypothetical protein WCA27_13125 [Candidatus Sulfotelmatobacter sp.]
MPITTIIIVIALALLGYALRRNLRCFWHVLYTGDLEPDWEKLGADYFIAPWERKRFMREKAAKAASAPADAAGK